MRVYLAHHTSFREAQHRFEIWTSGSFAPDALALLQSEKQKRTKAPIDWKDGNAVRDIAIRGKEKRIADALSEHFFDHPLAAFSPPYEPIGASTLGLQSGGSTPRSRTLAIAGPSGV